MESPSNTDQEELVEAVEDQETTTTSFSILCDKGLSSSIKIISWCNTMDLVALVTVENTIAVHRLNWQRIWFVPCETDRVITALCWKPDGKLISVGFEDGHYSILEVESGTSLFSSLKYGSSFHAHRESISYINWFVQSETSTVPQFGGRSNQFKDSAKTQLPRLWPLQGIDTDSRTLFSSPNMEMSSMSSLDQQETCFESSTTRLENQEPSNLDILLVADLNGSIYLYLFGIFQISQINLLDLMKKEDGKVGIISTSFSSDFSSLFVVVQHRSNDDSIGFDEEGNEVGPLGTTSTLIIETNILSTKRVEIMASVWQSVLIQDLYYRISAITQKMALDWSEAITPFFTKLKLLEQQDLSKHGIALEQGLLALLVGGPHVPFSIDSVMTQEELKKWDKTIEKTCNWLETLVTQHLKMTIERLIYRLTILKGYSKWTFSFSLIGFSESQIDSMMQAASNLLIHTNSFIPILWHFKKLYKNLLGWIIRCCSDLDEVEDSTYHEKFVSEILKNGIFNDKIAEFISGKIQAPKNDIPSIFSYSSNATSSFAAPQSKEQNGPIVVTAQLDGDDDLGLDESIDYGNQSIDSDKPDINPSLPTSIFSSKILNAETQNDGPSLAPEPSNSLIPNQLSSLLYFKEEDRRSFSSMRTKIQLQFENLAKSISDSLTSTFKILHEIQLFSRSEILPVNEDENAATEVFEMKDLLEQMRAEHCFAFLDTVPQATKIKSDSDYRLIFKDGSTIWVLKMSFKRDTKRFQFGISGVEIETSYESEESSEPHEELLNHVVSYKENYIMLLLKHSENHKVGRILKLNLTDLIYYPFKLNETNESSGIINYFDEVVMMHPFQHSSIDLTESQRLFQTYPASSIFLTGKRGVGILFCAPKRAVVLDFETDEAPEEE